MSTPGVGNMVVGGLILAGGLIVSIVSASAAGGGGRYVFAWGAILFGAIAFIRGLITYGNHAGTDVSGDAATPSTVKTQSYPGTGAPGATIPLVIKYGAPSETVQLRAMTELAPPERILAEALAGVVRRATAVTAAELAAIRSTLRDQLGATLKDDDIRALALARNQSPDGVVAFLATRNGALDSTMRATIVRGVFFVMMANGPRPYAMPGAIALGNAIGLSEAGVKELVGDMAGPLDGQRREVILPLVAESLRRGTATFRYPVLAPCTACGGIGADCKVCSEEGRVSSEQEISISFPTDVKAGERLKYAGKGDSPMSGGRPGDLFVEIAAKAG